MPCCSYRMRTVRQHVAGRVIDHRPQRGGALRRPDIEVAVGGIGQRLRRGRRAVVENVGGAVADPVCQAAVTGSDRATVA